LSEVSPKGFDLSCEDNGSGPGAAYVLMDLFDLLYINETAFKRCEVRESDIPKVVGREVVPCVGYFIGDVIFLLQRSLKECDNVMELFLTREPGAQLGREINPILVDRVRFDDGATHLAQCKGREI